MGYTVPDPRSAEAMKNKADDFNENIAKTAIADVISLISKSAGMGRYEIHITDHLSKEDVAKLKQLGYRVHKYLFDEGYKIYW